MAKSTYDPTERVYYMRSSSPLMGEQCQNCTHPIRIGEKYHKLDPEGKQLVHEKCYPKGNVH